MISVYRCGKASQKEASVRVAVWRQRTRNRRRACGGARSKIATHSHARKKLVVSVDMALAVASMAVQAMNAPIVIAGAGLHGASLAYYLTLRGVKPLIIEKHSVAAAASGKGGGFLARDWGSGPTVQLHKVSFALHEELARDLNIESYRKIPVLSVSPGKRSKRTTDICPWLDGDIRDSSWSEAPPGPNRRLRPAPHSR